MDRLLVVLGLGVWVVAGGPRIAEAWHRPEGLQIVDGVWLLVYLGFLFNFLGASWLRARGLPGPRALGFTIGQSLCGVALLPLGMPHFEGALLALVGAQTLLVVPGPWALSWVIVQGVPLLATILPTHELAGAAKATGEYVAFSVFAMTAFALRDQERRQRYELMQVQAELLGTRSLLEDTVARAEQHRLQMELHDTLGHHLSSASSYLDAARSGQLEHLDSTRDALDRLMDESRALVRGLKPRSIDLNKALEALRTSFPQVELELDLDFLGDLEPDVAWASFRAVQEGLTNAVRHGRAHRVRVSATRDGPEIQIRMENDGRPPKTLNEGLGLTSMRTRLAEVGGELTVEPGPPFALQFRFGENHQRP